MVKFFLLMILTLDIHAMTKNKNVKDCKEKSLGPCYQFPGRVRLYNNRYVRVWKKGTNRLYEITTQTESAFSDLKHLSMATEIYANFDMCLLKPEEQTGIAHICVQSVKDIKTSQMPE